MKENTNQVDYFNEFGRLYRDAIISAKNPDTWTNDPDPTSAMNRQMFSRIAEQEKIVLKYFKVSSPVLDLGCGFGRQTFMMARNNFDVTGVDSSDTFVDIAKDLFIRHKLNPKFQCDSVLTYRPDKPYGQITLFDVIEHFNSLEKRNFVQHLAQNICSADAFVIITVPYMNKDSLKDRLTNAYKWLTSHSAAISAKKEHPYPLPYKNTLIRLFVPYFDLKEYFHTGDTAFFIFARL